MKKTHPTYPNPIIQEAIIEVYFSRAQELVWESSNFAKYFEEVKEEYPTIEPVQQVSYQMLIGPQGVSQQTMPTEQRMKYTHKSNKFLIQLSDRLFVVNILHKYPGWQVVKDTVSSNWCACLKVLGECKPTHIGMRYINRIPRTTSEEKASEWLKDNDFIPSIALSSLSPVFSRVESSREKNNLTTVTLAEGDNAFILDIERVLICDPSFVSLDLADILDRLHSDVWDVFESAKGDKLQVLLNKE